MQVIEYITDKINKLQEGYVFTYTDFDIAVEKPSAVITALNRMVIVGKLRKLSKGRFYKPKRTEFGELVPDAFQVVKDLLEKDDKTIGYFTGYSIYNKLGFTTQISNTIQIGVNKEKKRLIRGIYKIEFLRQPNRISKDIVPVLQILDCIRTIKEMPDTTVDASCSRLLNLIQKLEKQEYIQFERLAMHYNASTRALAGAMIERIKGLTESRVFFDSLNPSTKYQLGITEQTLPNRLKWKIQ